MRILIDIGHPAHVHYFRNLYAELSKKHDVIVTCKSEKIVEDLLTYYCIKYIPVGHKANNIIGKIYKQIYFNKCIYEIIKKNNIDIAMGCSASVVQASIFSQAKSILFDDDDQAVQPLTKFFVSPLADCIISPDTLKYENLKNAIYYPGYQELAYLHPIYSSADPFILAKYGLDENDRYFILRFNAFKAHHDIGMGGMNIIQKRQLVSLLSEYGKVFITTEDNIDKEFEKYYCPVNPYEMHSFMSFATLFISDSQTMTSEAAVLGVPSLRCNSFVDKISYLEEEEKKYGLTFGFLPHQFDWMLIRIKELLSIPDLKQQWQKKREGMLKDKIDVTSFWVWFIENYPDSEKEIRRGDFNFDRFR